MEKIDMSLDDIIKLNRKAKKKLIAQNKNTASTKKPSFKTQGKIGALRSKYATKEKTAQLSNFSYQAATRQSVKKAKLATLKAKQRKQQTIQAQRKGRQTARQTLLARRRGIEARVKQLQSEANKIEHLVKKQQQQINTQVPETQLKRNRRFKRQPYQQPMNNQSNTFHKQKQQQQQLVQKKQKKSRRFVRQPYHQATNNQISMFQQQTRLKQQNKSLQQPHQQVNTQKSKRGRRFNRLKGNSTNLSSPSQSQLLTVSVNNSSNRPIQQSRPVNLNKSSQQNAVSLSDRFSVAQQYNRKKPRGKGGRASRTVLMTVLQ